MHQFLAWRSTAPDQHYHSLRTLSAPLTTAILSCTMKARPMKNRSWQFPTKGASAGKQHPNARLKANAFSRRHTHICHAVLRLSRRIGVQLLRDNLPVNAHSFPRNRGGMKCCMGVLPRFGCFVPVRFWFPFEGE